LLETPFMSRAACASELPRCAAGEGDPRGPLRAHRTGAFLQGHEPGDGLELRRLLSRGCVRHRSRHCPGAGHEEAVSRRRDRRRALTEAANRETWKDVVQMRLYDFLPSGNGYKVRLALRWLGLPFDYHEVDILKGESRTPSFLAKNRFGQ